MNKLYLWLDGIWQWIARTIFVRFEFNLPVDDLKALARQGTATFALTHGGIIEWLILSSWCRREGLGEIIVSNRKRILLLSRPKLFFKVFFRRKSYSDLFLSPAIPGPRLLFCPSHERKRLFDPTPVERLLADLYTAGANRIQLVPVFILWRKHMRGEGRTLGEYFFGLSSRPNWFGKVWYLFRKRMDSTVKALGMLSMQSKEAGTPEYDDAFDDTEAMRVAKNTRRRILVLYNQEMRVAVGPRYLSPHSVKETLMRDPELQRIIREVAEKEGVDRRKVMSRAYGNLTEIVSNYKFRFIEVMYVAMTWVYTRLFDGMVADEKELAEIREVMKTKPVVFIPCHRSHLDYLVIPYVLFIHDMVTAHTAAGINLAFWPVGPFLRMGGAFFIRRSFRGDILYSTCLKKYVEYLLKNKYNMKFFIEGTRSRSGKMLQPAYGFLKMVLEVNQHKITDDIALFPVSICYDEVPDLASYSKELAGGEKKKESASQLVKSRKIFKRNLGKVYVRFAKPIFARDLMANPDSALTLQKTAFQICKSINDVTPITPKSVVSSVMLAHPESSLPLEEILRTSVQISHYVAWSGIQLSVSEDDAFKRAVEQTVKRLHKSSTITVTDSVPRNYSCEPKKRILLNFYKNNAIHCLVTPAISLLAFLEAYREVGVVEPKIFREKFVHHALWIRNLLKFEFFFSPTQVFLDEIQKTIGYFTGTTKDDVLISSLIETTHKKFGHWADIMLYPRMLGELIESYLTVFRFVNDTSSQGTQEKKAWLLKALKFAEGWSAQGLMKFPESVSNQNYSNVLQLLENFKIVEIEKTLDGKTMLSVPSDDDRVENLITQTTSLLDCLGENSSKMGLPW